MLHVNRCRFSRLTERTCAAKNRMNRRIHAGWGQTPELCLSLTRTPTSCSQEFNLAWCPFWAKQVKPCSEGAIMYTCSSRPKPAAAANAAPSRPAQIGHAQIGHVRQLKTDPKAGQMGDRLTHSCGLTGAAGRFTAGSCDLQMKRWVPLNTDKQAGPAGPMTCRMPGRIADQRRCLNAMQCIATAAAPSVPGRRPLDPIRLGG